MRGLIHFQKNPIDIIPGKFVFSIDKLHPYKTFLPFSVDNDEHFQYQPFFEDFGPLPLHQIHYFIIISLNYMDEMQKRSEKKILNFYCSYFPQNISNAILLAASFRLIHLKMTAEESLKPFISILKNKSLVIPYRDASSYPSLYDLTILSCLKGLEKAISLGWYDPLNFDCQEWADCEMIENGDMNWLIPNKLMAFASPYPTNNVQGFYVCTPKEIVPAFQKYGITRIIRLNNKTYDENIFKNAGFKHTELYFPDGTNPPPTILKNFLEIIEGNDVIALHCKAGLGRTGTLAGCYIIKNYGFSAPEAIGWIRICRPGSIIGPQQQFLIDYENSLKCKKNIFSPYSKYDKVTSTIKNTSSFYSKKPSLSRPTTNNNYFGNRNINRSPTNSPRQKSKNPNSLCSQHSFTPAKPNTPSCNRSLNNKKTPLRVNTSVPNDNYEIRQNHSFISKNVNHNISNAPKVPQPRKLKRAINARKEIR